MDADAVLAEHAIAHYGVFRGEHARMAGLSERQIDRRIASRRWVQVIGDVYRLNGAPVSWKGDLLAACWTGGFRAVGVAASGPGWWSGLVEPGGERVVVVGWDVSSEGSGRHRGHLVCEDGKHRCPRDPPEQSA